MDSESMASSNTECEVLEGKVEEDGLVLEVVELLAGDLGTGLEVDEAERLGNGEMVTRGEALGGKVPDLANTTKLAVGVIRATWGLGVNKVWDTAPRLVTSGQCGLGFIRKKLLALAQATALSKQALAGSGLLLLGELANSFHCGGVLVGGAAEIVLCVQEIKVGTVELEKLLDGLLRPKIAPDARKAVAEGLGDAGAVFAQEADVEHGISYARNGRTRSKSESTRGSSLIPFLRM